MSGLGLVLSIAKDALSAQRYGMDVTGHNIANVNNPGYSRQSPVQVAKEPSLYGGLLLGRGVDTTQIVRASDQFIESRLMQQKSNMSSLEQMENYIQVMEGLFNENSETSISAMLADFWNLWHDIANNPSGASERTALYEHSISLSEQFNTLNADLTQLETDLTNAVSAGIHEINQITNEIAELNNQIVGTEAVSIANDLRDMRNTLVSELSEYIYTKSFEQSSGSLTVLTARGCVLVHTNSSYDLELGGDNGDRVEWQASGDATVDITDYITNGKLGGWLDMRDEVIAKYKLDLDGLAKEFVWAVNQQHSQGVGLQFFSSSVTGTYKTGSSGLLSTLTYGNKIDYDKDFKMWIEDGSVTPATSSSVTVDMGISTASVSNWGGNGGASDTYTFTVSIGGTVGTGRQEIAYSNSAGSVTGTISVTGTGSYSTSDLVTFDIGAGTLVAGNTLTVNTDSAGAPIPLDFLTVSQTASQTANSVSDTYIFTVKTGGTIGTGTQTIDWSNGVTTGTISITATGAYIVDGMTLTFTAGTLVEDDIFTITTDEDGAITEDTDGDPIVDLPSDWHWTLDSFKNQFNRQTPYVAASTSDNKLSFAPNTSGYELSADDYSGSNGFTAINTTITVNNYEAMTASSTAFELDRTAAGIWSIANKPGYVSAQIVPTPLSVTTAGNGDFSATYTFTVATGGGGTIGTDNVTIDWTSSVDGSGSFTLSGAAPIAQAVDGMTLTFTQGTLVAGDVFTMTTDGAGAATLATVPGDSGFGVDLDGNGSADITLSFATAVSGAGDLEFDITAASGDYSFGFSDAEAEDSGLMAALGINTFFQGNSAGNIGLNTVLNNKDYIAAAQIDANTGDFAVGDNTNALAIADLQYTPSNIAQWTCNRASAKSSANLTATVEGYYHSTVGSIGMKSASISRSKAFDEVMVNKLGEIRDSISAVSLDEEMTNIIKFQRAYAAAAKLISVSDEMLNTLLSIK